MKSQIFLFLIFAIIYCLEDTSYTSTITFSADKVESSGEGVNIDGTKAEITKSGSYLVTGTSSEGNLIIKESSVNVYLENLELSSNSTSPIIVNSKLSEVKIIAIKTVTLKDLEDSSSTSGECAVIKIKKNSQVTIQNQNNFKLEGKCKNVIKGGEQASIIFDVSNGEYTINAYQNGISSDGLLTFNGGIFTITTDNGDAIKSSPDDTDTESLGKIIVNAGTFNIKSKNDAFQAKNYIIIYKGTFDIKTENGYQSSSFNKDTSSAKGFKVSNDAENYGIIIYDGNFTLNTPDDALHSNRNVTIVNGNFIINSADDGIHAGYRLLIGTKDSSSGPNINILNSYEALEGLAIRIYSGKINVTAKDDGINAAGGSGNSDDQHGPRLLGPGPRPGPGPSPTPGPTPGGGGNSSYFISIYGGEINVNCEGDGLDSNGNIFIHGGDINVFSQGNADNEPIDHEGNFTLFSATVLCIGAKGMEYVHDGILKGNQKYAYSTASFSKNKVLIIKDGNNNIVKQKTIIRDATYGFYSSQDLNSNYKFYLCDSDGSNGKEISFSFGTPESGDDDQDIYDDDGNLILYDNSSSALKIFLLVFFIILFVIIAIVVVFLIIRRNKGKNRINEEELISDNNKEVN